MISFASLKARHLKEMARDLRNNRWEQDESGLIVPGMKVKWTGIVRSICNDGLGETVDHNLVTTEGLNHILDAVLHGSTQYTTWYLAPWTDNVTEQATWTAATFSSAAGELTTQYSQSTRVAFVESASAAGVVNNTGNPASFTSSVDNVVIRGLGLLSHSTKASTSGVLLSAIKYSTARTLVTTGDSIGLTYQVTLTDT
jgi:hypothetical protein